MTRQELITQAWETGNLAYLLRPYQRRYYNTIKRAIKKKVPLVGVTSNRKMGKTFILTLVLLELGLIQKFAQLHYYGEDTAKLKSRVFPQLKQLLRECPWPEGDPRRPGFKGAGKDRGMDTFYFPMTDSTIEFYPANEDIRGGNPSFAVVDEAGFINKLNELVNGTIRPAFLQTKGTCALISTPPLSTSHYWKELFEELERKGYGERGSLEEQCTPEEFEEIKESLRDPVTKELKPQWFREYLGQFVNDSRLTVLPKWDTKKHVKSKEWWEENVRKHPAYSQCLKFVGIDYGTEDFTSICFFTYFKPMEILIHEATVLTRGEVVTVGAIADFYYDRKAKLWGWERTKHPNLVIAECRDKIINQSLRAPPHLIPTRPVKKSQTKQPMTSAMVELVGNNQFVIIDTEENQIAIKTCEGAIWESEESRGHRFADGGSLGHFDTLDCTCYVHWMARAFYPHKPIVETPNWTTTHYDPDTYVPKDPMEKHPVGNPNLLPRPPESINTPRPTPIFKDQFGDIICSDFDFTNFGL